MSSKIRASRPADRYHVGDVISVSSSRFKHAITDIDKLGWCVWAKPIGSRDKREKRIPHYDLWEVDVFMTEVYKSKMKNK